MAKIEFTIKKGTNRNQLIDQMRRLGLLTRAESKDNGIQIDMNRRSGFRNLSVELKNRIEQHMRTKWNITESDTAWDDVVIRLRDSFLIDTDYLTGHYDTGCYYVFVIGHPDKTAYFYEKDTYESSLYQAIKERLVTIQEIELLSSIAIQND